MHIIHAPLNFLEHMLFFNPPIRNSVQTARIEWRIFTELIYEHMMRHSFTTTFWPCEPWCLENGTSQQMAHSYGFPSGSCSIVSLSDFLYSWKIVLLMFSFITNYYLLRWAIRDPFNIALPLQITKPIR